VLTDSESRVQPAAAAEPGPHLQDEFTSNLHAAITRSQAYLLGEQTPDGYWVGELIVDSTIVSDTVAYHHWNGKIDQEWQRKAVNHIFSMQLPDGGWNIYYGGPSEVNATIKAYLALKLAGIPVTDYRMLRAREVALNLFQALPGLDRAFSMGICSHDSLRGPADRQMVPREFLGDEQLVPGHAGAAGHHQPF
jgi:squalene-hopene/tetraprenyl-beta-curcumene cyclase